MNCIHCGAELEQDRMGWVCIDDLDGTPDGRNDGRSCADGEWHDVELTEADIAEETLRSRDYEAWAAL